MKSIASSKTKEKSPSPASAEGLQKNNLDSGTPASLETIEVCGQASLKYGGTNNLMVDSDGQPHLSPTATPAPVRRSMSQARRKKSIKPS